MELRTFFAQWAGEVLPGATCYLYQADTETLATGLQDAAGTVLANPFQASSDGKIQFAAPNGQYDLRVMSGGRDSHMRVQCLDLAEQLAAAQGEADRATGQAERAVGEADRAGSEAGRAEAARDAAMAAGKVYVDTAAGLAATTSGEYFNVLSADSDVFVTLYRNNAGIAEPLDEYPSAEGVYSKIQKTATRDVLRVTDAAGKAALRITRSRKLLVMGRNVFAELDKALAVVEKVFFTGHARGSAFRVSDSAGKTPISVTRRGRVRIWGRDILREIDALGSGAAFEAQLAAVNKQLTPGKNLLIVGDSLSAYTGSWARTILDALTDSDRTVTNLAVGGHTSSQQAGRVGALPFLITFQNNTILASGATPVTTSHMLHPDGVTLYTCWPISNQGTGPTWRARVSGVLGEFSSATFTDGVPDALVFTPDVGQISVDTPVEVGVPAVAEWAVGKEHDTILMGLGRNNFTETEVVKRDWLAIREWQRTLEKRLIVVTPPNKSTEGSTSGPDKYANFVELEQYAQTLFGDCAVISRQVLMRYGDGSESDNTAIADNRVPQSLTSDGLHWIPETSHAYIRAAAAAIINRKGW